METKLPVRWEGWLIQYANVSLHTCLKSEVEMWLLSGMRGLTRARQVRIM